VKAVAPHSARRAPHSPSPRGSVLVFAVALLALLAGVVTAFLLFVRQEYHATGNALRNVQSEQAAEAGLAHALRTVRQAVLTYRYYTPDGAWVPTGTLAEHAYIYTSAGLAGTAPATYPAAGPLRFFEYPGAPTATDLHAWLWFNTDATVFPKTTADSEPNPNVVFPDLTFTANKLAQYTTHDGQPKTNFTGGPAHYGLARPFILTFEPQRLPAMKGPEDPFFDLSCPTGKLVPLGYVKDPVTEQKRGQYVSNTRGEYYVWVADLDGKLSAYTQSWGLTPVNTGETDQVLAYNVISLIKSNAGMYVSEGALWNLPPDSLRSAGELALTSFMTGGLTGKDYYNTRYGLDRYFTVHLDPRRDTQQKEPPAELNINTANYETLVAALSRVPLMDNFIATDAASVTANQQKAQALAARICAKRPFLGRMDFEDFVAAHLNADPAQAADPVTDLTKPVGMISAALVKRVENQLRPYEALDLDQFGATSATTLPAEYNSVNTRTFMQARFTFFRQESTLAPLYHATDPAKNALISPKAFNNILNSISGKRRNDTYGYSYYSFDGVETPFSTTGGTPKFLYNELEDPIAAGLDRYVVERGDPNSNLEVGELREWHAANARGHYEMTFSTADDTQVVAYMGEGTATNPGDPVIFIRGNTQATPNSGQSLTGETPNLDPDLSDGTNVYQISDAMTGKATCHSFIHGPLRAYHIPDRGALKYDDPLQAPTATRTDGPLGNGDISWSPRFGFRSRFFAVYVLARGVTTESNGATGYGPTKRLEAVYDALTDKVLWRRWQTTELRNLGDPSP